jgi:nitroimidazol reductase NimA-like FMN-containing flavoprotein (pyridoxamine 5'-phosphate oxidase superfamily)
MATRLPGYGVPTSEEGMLAWGHVTDLFAGARLYWVGTTRPDGRPHAAPVWGAWVDETLYLETGRRTLKARNLLANPAVAVHLERGDDVVLVEGTMERAGELEPALFARVADAFERKYPYRPGDAGALWVVRPRTVLAWNDLRRMTRWRFGVPEGLGGSG